MEKTQQRSYLMTVVTAVVVGVLAFGAGMKWQQKRTSTAFQFGAGQNQLIESGQGYRAGMMGGNRGGMMGGTRGGFRPVNGEIISLDDKSITVKMQDGSSRIIFLSEKTAISEASSATKTDLKAGQTVAVFGTDNSDGSVTASSIQLNPILMMNGRGQSTSSGTAKPY